MYLGGERVTPDGGRRKGNECMSLTPEAESIAGDALQAIRDGEIVNREALIDWVHESVDSCATVIYTAQAIAYLQSSDNDGRAVDDGLIGPEQFRDGIPWPAMAYGALEADVYEALSAIDVDPNDDSEWPRLKCDGCEAWVAEYGDEDASLCDECCAENAKDVTL